MDHGRRMRYHGIAEFVTLLKGRQSHQVIDAASILPSHYQQYRLTRERGNIKLPYRQTFAILKREKTQVRNLRLRRDE